MIASFGDKSTEALFHGLHGRPVQRIPNDIRAVAIRRLDLLNAAARLSDLRATPGNRLEALRGTFKGMHSIRINDQWRIVFRWEGNDAYDVRITDYH